MNFGWKKSKFPTVVWWTNINNSFSIPLAHFYQNAKTARFQMFDYGSGNKKLYGSESVPNYELNLIKVPIFVYHGTIDGLVPPKVIHSTRHQHWLFIQNFLPHSRASWNLESCCQQSPRSFSLMDSTIWIWSTLMKQEEYSKRFWKIWNDFSKLIKIIQLKMLRRTIINLIGYL